MVSKHLVCMVRSASFPGRWERGCQWLCLRLVFYYFSFKGIDDEHCFDSEATMVTSKNVQNLKCLYNYKCFVSAGERWFFMGLGVSILSDLHLVAHYWRETRIHWYMFRNTATDCHKKGLIRFWGFLLIPSQPAASLTSMFSVLPTPT